MARGKVEDKSKIRTVSLRDDEFGEIKAIGKNSLTGGIRTMKDITKLVIEFGDGDIELGVSKLRVAMSRERK